MGKSSGGVRGGGASKVSLDVYSPALNSAIADTERQIRTRKTEKLVAIGEDGEIVFSKSGTSDRVRFTAVEIGLMSGKNLVLTHNHPLERANRYRIGSSFSPDDFGMAVRTNAREVRAVTERYTFSVKRPQSGWGVTREELRWKAMSIEDRVISGLQVYIKNYKGDKNVARGRAEELAGHLITKELSKLYGWKYKRTKL